MKVKTRFAPSPTGYLHIGGVRTALFSWAYARQQQGEFILRIEDTDQERSTQESVDVILDGLSWLDLSADTGPVFQSQRFDRYREVIQQMVASGHAYACDCSKERLEKMRAEQEAKKLKPKYDGHCRVRKDVDRSKPHVVRFRNPDTGSVVFRDLIKGSIEFNNAELDDLVILRSDNTPTYNLSVVVDDYDMQITHVIRGDDHINNTPRQINILRALNAPIPQYAHVPMILGADGKRLSKRHGAISVTEYRDQGYLPHALLNYLARLGWSHGDQEIFSRDEIVALFNLENVNNSAAAFNPVKLSWLNQQYIQKTSNQELANLLRPFLDQEKIDVQVGAVLEEVIAVQKERAHTLVELAQLCFCFYHPVAEYDAKTARKHLKAELKDPFEALIVELSAITSWTAQTIKATVQAVADRYTLNFGHLAQPLRVALTGGAPTPGIDITAFLIGQESVCVRIRQALDYIALHSNNHQPTLPLSEGGQGSGMN